MLGGTISSIKHVYFKHGFAKTSYFTERSPRPGSKLCDVIDENGGWPHRGGQVNDRFLGSIPPRHLINTSIKTNQPQTPPGSFNGAGKSCLPPANLAVLFERSSLRSSRTRFCSHHAIAATKHAPDTPKHAPDAPWQVARARLHEEARFVLF